MARAVGLDIGARSVKVVELGGSAKSPRIQRMAIRQIPPPPAVEQIEDEEHVYDPDEVVVDLIKDLFKELALPKDDVCASFDSGITVMREITVPFFEDAQIEKIVTFEAENHLHSYSIEDVVVNYVKTGETRDGSRLTIFATPKVELARRIAILRRAGIEPASVDLDTTSLYSALKTIGYFEETPNCLVIDVGSHTTNLMMVTEGKPRVARSFLLGSGSLEAEVANEMNITIEDARKRVLGGGPGVSDDLLVPAGEALAEEETALATADVAADRRLAFVKKLQREAYRSLVSVRTETQPEKVLLFGGGSLIPEVAEKLSEQLGLPLEHGNILDKIESKTMSAEPEYAGAVLGSAVGCGLRMMGAKDLGVELLRDEFAPSNTFDVIKTALGVAVTLLFLTVLVATIAKRDELQMQKLMYGNWKFAARAMYLRVEPSYLNQVENKAYDAVKRRGEALTLAKKWLDGMPQDAKVVSRIANHLKTRHKRLEERLGQAKDIPKVPSALEAWVEIYRALSATPREDLGRWFQVTQLTIAENRFSMKIVMQESQTLDKVVELLQNSEYLKERAKARGRFIERGTVQRLRDGKVRVEVNMRFKEDD